MALLSILRKRRFFNNFSIPGSPNELQSSWNTHTDIPSLSKKLSTLSICVEERNTRRSQSSRSGNRALHVERVSLSIVPIRRAPKAEWRERFTYEKSRCVIRHAHDRKPRRIGTGAGKCELDFVATQTTPPNAPIRPRLRGSRACNRGCSGDVDLSGSWRGRSSAWIVYGSRACPASTSQADFPH